MESEDVTDQEAIKMREQLDPGQTAVVSHNYSVEGEDVNLLFYGVKTDEEKRSYFWNTSHPEGASMGAQAQFLGIERDEEQYLRTDHYLDEEGEEQDVDMEDIEWLNYGEIPEVVQHQIEEKDLETDLDHLDV
jgi:hypothetical protein